MRIIDIGIVTSAVLAVAIGSFGASAVEGCKPEPKNPPVADADACPPPSMGAPAPCVAQDASEGGVVVQWPDTPAGHACASLEAAHCPEAHPQGIEGCVGVIEKTVDAGVFNLDPACIAKANGDATAIRNCGVRCQMK